MRVYMFLYVFWFIFCRDALKTRLVISPKKKISGRAFCVLLFFTYIAVITMFRHRSVGTDTWNYSRGFVMLANIESFSDVMATEMKAPIYTIIQYFISRISSNPQMYIATFSLIIALGFGIYIYRSSKDVWFSCFLYVGTVHLFFTMNGMKQATAEVIAINAYLDLRDNIKSKRGWLLYIAALGVHPTCLFLFPAILFSQMADRSSVKKMAFVSALSAAATGYFISYGIDLFTAIFPAYAGYGGADGVLNFSVHRGRIIIYYAFLAGHALLYAIRAWKKKTSDRDFPSAVFGSVLAMMFSKTELIKRLINYYEIPFFVFIPTVFSLYPKEERKLLYFLSFIAFFMFSTWNLLENKSNVVPYRFFFM